MKDRYCIWDKAHAFAQEKHKGQKYGEHDYMHHLEQVAEVCDEFYTGIVDTGLIYSIAILHDILEDTDTTYEELSHEFGGEVGMAVYMLTKVKGEDYNDYISAVKTNPLSLYVKKWDTFCNLQESLKQGDVRRVNKYAKQLALLTEEKSC